MDEEGGLMGGIGFGVYMGTMTFIWCCVVGLAVYVGWPASIFFVGGAVVFAAVGGFLAWKFHW